MKYGLWVPWIGIITLAAISAGGLHVVDAFHKIETGISVAEPRDYAMYFTVTGLVVLLALSAGRRAFCHYGCWMAPFMGMGTRIKDFFGWPSLGLQATTSACKQCRTCDRNCPMSLTVSEMVQAGSMDDAECILCGTCVDNCPKGAIKYSWRPSRGPTAR